MQRENKEAKMWFHHWHHIATGARLATRGLRHYSGRGRGLVAAALYADDHGRDHHAVWDYHVTAVLSQKLSVTEREVSDGADLFAGGRVDYQHVADREGSIEQQRDACYEVSQSALSGQA